ncbi:hypothetical protein HK099_004226 [Clydaea vesicula]|uniref:Uncharacterized protein n=1 Tax=Clydaea vesicula TaxID=447962 RepID=A0AAD5XZR2_9FUNG|nr:hypothetical protein HK099_004226 [Clydaea vesicula]KAJ3385903.1 hypothetical protein HDU92_002800 [Lobulomyces angularis]
MLTNPNNQDSDSKQIANASNTQSLTVNNKAVDNNEVIDSLNSLKQISLQALNSVVQRLVEEEVAREATVEDIPPSPTSPSSPSSTHSASNSNSKLSKRTSFTKPLTDFLSIKQNNDKSLHSKSAENFSTNIIEIEEQDKVSFADMLHNSAGASSLNSDVLSREVVQSLPEKLKEFEHNRRVSIGVTNKSLDNNSQSEVKIKLELAENKFETDHNLALALAALCNGLYQILETDALPSNSESYQSISSNQNTPCEHTNSVQDVLSNNIVVVDGNSPSNTSPLENNAINLVHQENIITQLQNVQAQRPDLNNSSQDQRSLWSETDRLMIVIQEICKKKHLSKDLPSYEDVVKDSKNNEKVSLCSEKEKSEVNERSLENVLVAIDRVQRLAPRAFGQDVLMSENFKKKINQAEILNLLDRLLKNNEQFNGQRAFVDSESKFSKLNVLVDLITASHKRSLMDQKATLSDGNAKMMEIGRITKVIDIQSKRRFKDQDWVSPEQKLIMDLNKLQQELEKISSKKLNNQRFELSDGKVKQFYIGGVLKQMDKLQSRKLNNQCAMSSGQKQEQKFEDIEKLLDKLNKPSLKVDQRASINSRDEIDKLMDKLTKPVLVKDQRACINDRSKSPILK